MIAEASLIAANWKLAVGGVALILIGAADMTVAPQTLEDYGLKGLLLITVIFLVRQLLKSQIEHKQEMKEERANHQATTAQREEKMVTALNKQADASDRMAAQIEEQTTYFKTVTRNIVDQHLHGPQKPLP
jgi:hypothetical protein